MKKFTRLLFISMAPFIVLGVMVALTDPYNFIRSSNFISSAIKKKCLSRTNESIPRGNIVWKAIEFKRSPVSSVLIGDSRTFDFDQDYFSKKLGHKIYNFGIPGGNCLSTIDIFWYVNEYIKLDTVFIQVDFSTYNNFVDYSLFEKYRYISHNPVNYLLSRDYIFDSFTVIYYSLTKDEKIVNRSYKNRENWNDVIQVVSPRFRSYEYPKKYYREFEKISQYCKENDIVLYFLILPDYHESKQLISKFNLQEDYKRFISDITGLGETLNFNYNTPFSAQKENYMDYFHIKPSKTGLVTDMIAERVKVNSRF